MAVNKNALIRYKALDKCFRNSGRKYFIDDLLEACNRALQALNPKSDGISIRQIYEDIRYMESEQGWSVRLLRGRVGRKVYYYYEDRSFSINNQPLNKFEAEQIRAALHVLSRFKGLPQFNWADEQILKLQQAYNLEERNYKIIDFDNNEYLVGQEYLSTLFNAILYKKVILIKYQPFTRDEPFEHKVHPYYLKQYNNRWFLFGRNPDYETISVFALDRIFAVEEINDVYQSPLLEFDEYFEDLIGITIPENKKVEEIRIHVDKSLWPYIKTKPIHGSQKVLERTNEYTEIEISVYVNYELISLLLSFGSRIMVISPEALRLKMIEQAKLILNKYL